MNHLIFTAVLTACLEIGGYQQGPEFFGPSPEGLGHDYHYDSGQLNSSHTGSCTPLVFTHSNMFIAVFGRYNIHTRVFRWLITIYLIVTALTGFQFSNLLPYLLQVIPTVSGYYRRTHQKIIQCNTGLATQTGVQREDIGGSWGKWVWGSCSPVPNMCPES
ncbi:hypothetical protein DSO57_1030115 [Entomophthora muscae]|uniref:Uncharacterized protein n=1 Tax=Entomophthora muscae TaxID=34485 RepID=A0ACC2TC98_9FUNG|nr:hypothetical protein DSO57_1030115 [Entomophthora muscae]